MGAGESREDRNAGESREESKATTALAVGAAVVLAAGAIFSLLASGSSNSVSNENQNENGNENEDEDEEMMKAPGQNGLTIRRKDFEENPKGYFRDLRKGK